MRECQRDKLVCGGQRRHERERESERESVCVHETERVSERQREIE